MCPFFEQLSTIFGKPVQIKENLILQSMDSRRWVECEDTDELSSTTPSSVGLSETIFTFECVPSTSAAAISTPSKSTATPSENPIEIIPENSTTTPPSILTITRSANSTATPSPNLPTTSSSNLPTPNPTATASSNLPSTGSRTFAENLRKRRPKSCNDELLKIESQHNAMLQEKLNLEKAKLKLEEEKVTIRKIKLEMQQEKMILDYKLKKRKLKQKERLTRYKIEMKYGKN